MKNRALQIATAATLYLIGMGHGVVLGARSADEPLPPLTASQLRVEDALCIAALDMALASQDSVLKWAGEQRGPVQFDWAGRP